MAEPRKHPHTYSVLAIPEGGDCLVVVEFDNRPGWFKRVATFESYDRAVDYAEMENALVEDWPDEADALGSRDDVNGGPPDDLPPSPNSGIKKIVERLATEKGGDHGLADKPRDDQPRADPPPAAEPGQAEQHTDSPAEAGAGVSSGIPDAAPAEIQELTPKEPFGTGRKPPDTFEGQDASEEGPVGVQPEAPHDMPDEGGQPVAAASEPERTTDEGIDDSASAAADPVECHPAAQVLNLDPASERVLHAITVLDGEGGKISVTTLAQSTGAPLESIGAALDVLQRRGYVHVFLPNEIPQEELRTRGAIRLCKAAPAEPEILPPSRLDGTPRPDAQGGVVPVPLERVEKGHDTRSPENESEPPPEDEPENDLTPLFTALAPFRSAAFRDKLTEREKAVLDVYIAAAVATERLTGLQIAQRSAVKSGTLPYILDQLVGKGALIRERKGTLPYLVGFKPSAARPVLPAPPAAPTTTIAVPAKVKRRFSDHAPLQPELVAGLAETHPAIVEGRTLFPSTVVTAAESPRLLVSGENSRKIGDRVVKGPWRGMPIFTLTLEERATCPRSCAVYRQCYGNAMQLARRHVVDQDFFDKMGVELFNLQQAHPDGFVVRLHILGDFPSPDYVAAWSIWLEDYPALHVFGYTAWQVDSEIGALIVKLRDAQWNRFAVRTSGAAAQPCGAVTIFRMPEGPRVAEGIVCPAMTGKTDCCGTCGLCWAEAAAGETIVFIAHGKMGRPREMAALPAPDPAAPDPAPTVPPPFKAGPLPTSKGQPASSPFRNYGRRAAPPPPGARVESPDEFLARGGKVQKVQTAWAMGSGGGDGIVGVTVRPKTGN